MSAKMSYRECSVTPDELAAGVRVADQVQQQCIGLEALENSVIIPRAHFDEAMALVERLLAPPRRRVLANSDLDLLYRTFKALGAA